MLFPFTVTNPQKSHSHDIAYTETTQNDILSSKPPNIFQYNNGREGG